jgi:hypothetical protein
MPVVFVGAILDHWNQRLVAGDKAVAAVDVHQITDTLQLWEGQIRTVEQEVPDPLFMNLIGPTGAKQIGQGNLHQKITQRGGIKDASVEDNAEAACSQ